MPLLFLTASLWACSEAGGGSASAPFERVSRPAFDGQAAFALLQEQVAFGPRIPGQDGHARQLDWMRAWLQKNGH